ncbi:hypothetical protein [Fusobacterium sp.]|uniref:hypothetical protein n=1 Tax=Fusobacterium sp. TaxID=68766 RepID=UPI00396CD321
MEKIVKRLLAILMVTVVTACGNSNIDGVKGAYEEHMADQRPGVEWLINSARICGMNKSENIEIMVDNLDSFIARNQELETVLTPALAAFDTFTEPEDMAIMVKLLNRITLNPTDIRNFGNTILASGVTIPKAENLDSFEWWEYKKDNTSYVAAGDKKTGYLVFKILNDGEQFQPEKICWHNSTADKMEEALLTELDQHIALLYSMIVSVFVYGIDNGAIAKDLNK